VTDTDLPGSFRVLDGFRRYLTPRETWVMDRFSLEVAADATEFAEVFGTKGPSMRETVRKLRRRGFVKNQPRVIFSISLGG